MDEQRQSPTTPTSFLSPASPTALSHSPTSTSTHSHFHSFHRRFRHPSSSHSPGSPTDSNPKSPLSTAEPVQSVKSNEANREAVREARRFINTHIRDDWSFDPCPNKDSPGPSTVSQDQTSGDEEFPPPIGYTRRQSGSSDAPSDDDGYHDTRDPMWVDGDPGDNHTFKFESPEDVGNAIRARRKAKRRKDKEEMGWNNGLRIWTARRNEWTRATKTPPDTGTLSRGRHHDELGAESLGKPPDSSQTESDPVRPLSPPDSRSDKESEKLDVDSEDSEDYDEYYLPIQPPLIPSTNPIRARLNRDLSPTIYSKFVVQGLTPSVPLPLPLVVQSLIEGWKDENWFPRPSAPPAVPAEPSRLTAKGGSSVVAQAKRLTRLGRDREKERSKRGSVGGVGDVMRKALGLKGHKAEDVPVSRTGGSSTGYGEKDDGNEAEGDLLVARDQKWQ